MDRRSFLTLSGTGLTGLSGCLSQSGSTSAGESESTGKRPTTTETPVRRTADNIMVTFTVVDSHKPTDDTANAKFDASQVTVTGTMDPSGCNRPILSSIRYNALDGVILLGIGTESPYTGTVTPECGNASYDYRSVVTVDSGEPTAVDLLYEYQAKDNRSFNLVKDST